MGKAKAKSRSRSRSNRKDRRRSPSRNASKKDTRRKSPSPPRKRRASPSPAQKRRPSPSPPQKRRASSSGSPVRSRSTSSKKKTVTADAKSQDALPSSTDGGPAKEAPKKPPKPPQVVTVTFKTRPFGMAPSKADGVTGYVVGKVAEDKPAAQAGVQQGWVLVAVGGTPCKGSDSQAAQALLKDCALPVEVKFEKEAEAGLSDSEEEDEEERDGTDIADVRAANREKHQAELANIDELPVERSPEGMPEPISCWKDAYERGILSAPLIHKLKAAGLKRPTPIQRHAIPILRSKPESYDMIAQAQTGSGKTFAFVIPTVARLVMEGTSARPFFAGAVAQACPQLLVLSPTRELATQTANEISVLTKGTKISQMTIFGGESIGDTVSKIGKEQLDIICATPGRLISLIDAHKISLSYVDMVVLDEADQMLEKGLEVMCAELLVGRDMPAPSSGRQTLLFSATMPQKIRDLTPQILRETRTANLLIGHYGDDQGGSCESITQMLKWCPDENQRIQEMCRDLGKVWDRRRGRVVIFSNMRITADKLTMRLQQQGFSCKHLHGKLEQYVRDQTFDEFRRGAFDILVATNVASRGLDFPDIALVVQFNLPKEIEIYTHRIGRTGRIGQVGIALAYVGPKDRHLNERLASFLELNKQEVPSFLRPQRRPSPPRRGGGGRSPPRRGGGRY